MKRAIHSDKKIVVDILYESFADNKSVRYVAGKSEKKIRALMAYSFEICHADGEVLISEDKQSVALIKFPDRPEKTWLSLYWNLYLIFNCVGLINIPKIVKRESFINSKYPKRAFTYLWFIGVRPETQGKGMGTQVLQHILKIAAQRGEEVLLETSTQKNIKWYQQNRFEIYHRTEAFGFPFYFFKTDSKN